MNQEQPSLGFSARMQIPIVTGTGCGCTLLSAFDGALFTSALVVVYGARGWRSDEEGDARA